MRTPHSCFELPSARRPFALVGALILFCTVALAAPGAATPAAGAPDAPSVPDTPASTTAVQAPMEESS
ncbi:MAG: hypothetical protein OXG35_32235, partial [Acidobacteria bacterium]|nr:hypothetical protein [Acidobacteriota bacterium]